MTLYFPTASTINAFLAKGPTVVTQNHRLIEVIATYFANKQIETLALMPQIPPLLRNCCRWKEPDWTQAIFRLEKALIACATIKAKL